MTEYRWMPWFFSNNPDPDNFNNVANWAEIIPSGGARLPASASPGPTDLVIFGNPAFQFPGTPSGHISGNATVNEIEFDQVSNPPPSGWFVDGKLTTATLHPLSGGIVHVTGSLTVTGNVASTTQPATIELDGAGSLELDGSVGALAVAFTATNQSLTLKGASATSPIAISVRNFQSGDSIILPGNLTTFGAPGEFDVYSGSMKIATINFINGIDEKTIVPQANGSNTTLIADPLPFNPLQDPVGNQVTWQFIHNNEAPGGKEILEPYIPVYADPRNTSGITSASISAAG